MHASPILDADGQPFRTEAPGYESLPGWGGSRHWEAAESTRLNSAHWLYAQDKPINLWLAEHLVTLRARAIYESRQNGIIAGMICTHADDIVGPDGPTLQVQSDDENYDRALERLWRDWFSAPTMRPNVSGAAMLKLWIRGLWRSGEFLARIATDPSADGPVAMRVWPVHPRRLATPVDLTGDPNVVMGIRFDAFGRPASYHIQDAAMNGQAVTTLTSQPWPADLILHEFIVDEEDQARGIPWETPALNPAAEMRDYDDQVQDAARQQADQCGLLYADNPDAPVWTTPESTTVERRTIRMVPPGWKPWQYQATAPPVTYESYRQERHREIGRPTSMPLMLVRLDASGHNYSSARIDLQGYAIAVQGIQTWLSGSDRSRGVLGRLADEIAIEARFTILALRRRPSQIKYRWTWPRRPHVDPTKEAMGEAIGLKNMTLTLSDAVTARGRDLETHIAAMKRELELLKEAGLPIPAEWLNNPNTILSMLASDSGAETDGQPATQGA